MPRLFPFHRIGYTRDAGDPSSLLAPPYDVIGTPEAEELRARSPYNAVRLVLPEGTGRERYAGAAARLEEWLAEGVLAADPLPALYLYRQTFAADGTTRERLTFFAAVALSPFGAGEVLPHEETHAGPREDRLALTLACRAQLSPVFVVARDPDARLRSLLRRAGEEAEPVLHARTPDGVVHALARLPADALALRICEVAGAEPLLIADGHHRYETALAAMGRLPGSEAAKAVLACVAVEGDPGLLVLPTHRAVRTAPPGGAWAAAVEAAFRTDPLGDADPRAAAAALEVGGALALLEPGKERALLLRPRGRSLSEAGLGPAWRRIGSAVFDRLVLGGILGTDAETAAEGGLLGYHRDPEEAVAAAAPGGAAFLLAPLAVPDIRAAVAEGGRLPPKTTYFAPKIPSGLVFRRL